MLNEPDGRPLGILYKSDLLEVDYIKKIDISDKTKTDATNLEQVIEQITKEFITKKKWDKNGIINNARLQNNTTLQEAKDRMVQISDQVNDVLGLVI